MLDSTLFYLKGLEPPSERHQRCAKGAAAPWQTRLCHTLQATRAGFEGVSPPSLIIVVIRKDGEFSFQEGKRALRMPPRGGTSG